MFVKTQVFEDNGDENIDKTNNEAEDQNSDVEVDD
jgi:hypothetical protein